jgi:hypothetical protein
MLGKSEVQHYGTAAGTAVVEPAPDCRPWLLFRRVRQHSACRSRTVQTCCRAGAAITK